MIVEMHVLQNVAPSNLNRDDQGTPKSAWFGGHNRQRVSSQAWKRAVRSHFNTVLDPAVRGVRTRRIVDALTPALREYDIPEDQIPALVTATLEPLFKVADGLSPYLLFLAPQEITALAKLVRGHAAGENAGGKPESAAWFKRILSHGHAVDISLFGRMIADQGSGNVEAAACVAQAISTNRVPQASVDYFTAIDDLQPTGEHGAAMLGTTEFSASCFYRYASVDIAQLLANLSGDVALTQQALSAFLEAFVLSIPDGKQHSFATFTLPSLVMGVVRDSAERWQLANAFARPLSPKRDESLIDLSKLALDAHWHDHTTMYGDEGITRVAVAQLGDTPLPNLGAYQVKNMSTWVATVTEAALGKGARQ